MVPLLKALGALTDGPRLLPTPISGGSRGTGCLFKLQHLCAQTSALLKNK